MIFKMSPLLATLLLVGGCYRNTIETGLPAANAMPYQKTAQFFLWGLVGEDVLAQREPDSLRVDVTTSRAGCEWFG